MPNSQVANPIDSSVAAVLELFAGPLEQVSFPDVDRATLAELAMGVRRTAEDVTQARALLESAEQALHQSREALLARAQRALAYARIYAEGDAALRASLDGIALPAGASPATRAEALGTPVGSPKKRGRPRKGLEGHLPFEPSLSESDALHVGLAPDLEIDAAS